MASLYDSDFHAWTQDQAMRLRRLLAERSNVDLDFENIAEEIESVGKSDRREVSSRLETILTHLLKIAYSPAFEPMNGWRGTVRTQRRDLLRILTQSPSLRAFAAAELAQCHIAAVEEARLSHVDMTLVPLPSECPWDLDTQILNPDWLPEPRIQ
jgi:hypothetical protein